MAADLSQKDLASSMGVTKGYVSLIESGRRAVRVERLNELETALGVPAEIIVFLSSTSAGETECPKSIKANMQKLVSLALKVKSFD